MTNILNKMAMGNKGGRIVWLDYMKVLGMVLIVWGHYFPSHFSMFIYAFNVPLFFFVSGYLAKQEHIYWKEFTKKTYTSLFIPIVLISAINIFVGICRGIYVIKVVPVSCVLILTGFHSFYGFPGCGAMWFVYTLIIIKVLHNAVVRRMCLQLLLFALCMVIAIWYGALSCKISSSWLNIFLAYPSFAIGNWCISLGKVSFIRKLFFCPPLCGLSCENYKIRKFCYSTLIVLSVIILFASVFWLSSYNGVVLMYIGKYGHNILLFALSAYLGILAMFLLSIFFERYRTKVITILSSGTILILGFHAYGILIMKAILRNVFVMQDSYMNDIFTLVGSLFIVLLFYPIIIFVKRYIPVLVGKRK